MTINRNYADFCHFGVVWAEVGSRGGSPDTEKAPARSPTRPDGGKTVPATSIECCGYKGGRHKESVQPGRFRGAERSEDVDLMGDIPVTGNGAATRWSITRFHPQPVFGTVIHTRATTSLISTPNIACNDQGAEVC
jgi:hypothetical protein